MGILDTLLCTKGIKRYNSKLLYWQGDVNIWNGLPWERLYIETALMPYLKDLGKLTEDVEFAFFLYNIPLQSLINIFLLFYCSSTQRLVLAASVT